MELLWNLHMRAIRARALVVVLVSISGPKNNNSDKEWRKDMSTSTRLVVAEASARIFDVPSRGQCKSSPRLDYMGQLEATRTTATISVRLLPLVGFLFPSATVRLDRGLSLAAAFVGLLV